MPDRDAQAVFVHALPALIPTGCLREGVAVVLDVLRATTCMVRALESGAREIRPCREIAEARALASCFEPGDALLAGERSGVRIDGFDLGNSPRGFTNEIVKGRRIVMTTTNGTQAVHAALEAQDIFVASFANITSTVEYLKVHHQAQPIHVIAAGTDGQISLEDTLLAGALLEHLPERILANDTAQLARLAWKGLGRHQELELVSKRLSQVFAESRGGRRNCEIGNHQDVRDAALLNQFQVVAKLERDPIRIVRVA